jgi:putative restriction endonuclease
MVNFIDELHKLKVHRSGQQISMHKPLLLLLTIAQMIRENKRQFSFDDVDEPLTELIKKYGLRTTKAVNSQYPFIYLASNANIWNCTIEKSILRNSGAATKNELKGAIGSFPETFYSYLLDVKHATGVIQFLLDQYWPEAYHNDILSDIGLMDFVPVQPTLRKERSRFFVEQVLDAYERKCAICNQSIRLGDALLGIDACHVKPIQHFGADHIANGIALCKLHHWALDRGAISFSDEMTLLISSKLNGNKLTENFTMHHGQEIHQPRKGEWALEQDNIRYHKSFIFVH